MLNSFMQIQLVNNYIEPIIIKTMAIITSIDYFGLLHIITFTITTTTMRLIYLYQNINKLA